MLLKLPGKVIYFPEVKSLEFERKENYILLIVNGEQQHLLFTTGRPGSLKSQIELFIHDLGEEPDLKRFLTFTSDCDPTWKDLFLKLAHLNLHELKRAFHEVGKSNIKK